MTLQRSLVVAGALVFASGAAANEPSPFAQPGTGDTLLLAQNGAAAGKPAGQVIMTTSNLSARRDDGSERALGRRSVIYEGDTLVTGADGITQVRMVDGALLSLRRETRFKIEEFRYGDVPDDQQRGFFSLLRGGFRTLTGAIGRVVNQAYRVSTPVATIGIRGTHYGLRLCVEGDCAAEGVDRDGLFGGVVDGRISSDNTGGSSTFDNDEYFYVADANSAADTLLAPPGVVFGSDLPLPSAGEVGGLRSLSPEADEIQDGQQTAASEALDANLLRLGLLTSTQTVTLPSAFNNTVLTNAQVAPDNSVAVTSFLGLRGGLTMLGNAFGAQNTSVGALDSSSFVVLDTQNSSVPAMQNVDDSSCSPCIAFANPSGSTLVAGSQGSNSALGVNWGRWEGSWTGTAQFSQSGDASVGQLHFMFANSLIPDANLPANGRFLYNNIVGGTAPTNQAGVPGMLTSASVDVDFGAQTVASYNLELSVGVDTVMANNFQNGATPISAAVNGGILLEGTCTGSCGQSPVGLTGTASVNFVGNIADGGNGARPTGLISSYGLGGLAGDNTTPIGYNGTFVAEPTN